MTAHVARLDEADAWLALRIGFVTDMRHVYNPLNNQARYPCKLHIPLL